MPETTSISAKLEKIHRSSIRTVFFYENFYTAIAVLKTVLEKKKSYHILIFSDNTMRQLKIISKLAEIQLPKEKLIIVNEDGVSEDYCIAFSYQNLESLYDYLEAIKDPLFIISKGELRIIAEDHLKVLLEILESLNPDLEVMAFLKLETLEKDEVAVISSLFDLTVLLKKQEEYFGFGEEIYEFHIIESIIPEIQPGMDYFRVSPDMSIIAK